ncbi:MAG TPA: helix-turn-helix domain-containing protein, partial [Chitinophagaceae bacterium]|nr:helix-turn-helix domain-containing protein [Chitinophagaceae bacterium]
MTKLKYTVIKSRAQYNKYCKIADKLIDLEDTTREQEEELKLLTVLIEKWDADHNIFKDQDPVQLIKSLMKEHNLKAADLTRILSISKSYLSEILNYKKGLSKEVIRRLADHFKLNQEAFNREYTLKNVVKEGKREVSKIAISQK